MIRITGKRDGFRRCGVAHPAAETVYQDKRFTKAELAVLKADPMLTVTVVEDDAREKAEAAAKAKAEAEAKAKAEAEAETKAKAEAEAKKKLKGK